MKTGIDDFLAAGGDIDELRMRATRTIPSAPVANAGGVELTAAQRRFLEDAGVRRLLAGQCDADEDPTPSAVDYRFVMRLALKGCRDQEDLRALLLHRLQVSERPEKSGDDRYLQRTIGRALERAEALALERVDVSLSLGEIVLVQPEDNAQETTYRVTGTSGWTAEVDQRTLLDVRRMRSVVLAATGLLPTTVKARDWDDHLGWVLSERSRVEVVPAELSEFGLLRQVIVTVFEDAPQLPPLRDGLDGIEEIVTPFPHENEDGEIVVTFTELVKLLRTELPSLNPTPHAIGRALREIGARKTQRRFSGRRTKVWVVRRTSLPDSCADDADPADAEIGGDSGSAGDEADEPPRDPAPDPSPPDRSRW